jgi:hypothetical protein
MNNETAVTAHRSEHIEWLNKLFFYQDDLALWDRHLVEIGGKNTRRETMAEIEKFQNQVTIQKEHIDILRHEIREDQQDIEKAIAGNHSMGLLSKGAKSLELKERMNRFEELFAEFRVNLLNFMSKWM